MEQITGWVLNKQKDGGGGWRVCLAHSRDERSLSFSPSLQMMPGATLNPRGPSGGGQTIICYLMATAFPDTFHEEQSIVCHFCLQMRGTPPVHSLRPIVTSLHLTKPELLRLDNLLYNFLYFCLNILPSLAVVIFPCTVLCCSLLYCTALYAFPKC
ncbi:hypothetical protein ANANG_G00021710 [Anguilla anguilla]|uniref:Uncharacterized protein n=1 Tax=Anguilla anguilla TaxID=7936 RepID=A0A9D3S6P4_ANGAN|nr:hypothetical protein ANANG_G00021710 [Anguilla anguilla]